MNGFLEIETIELPGSELHGYVIKGTTDMTAKEAIDHLERVKKIIQQGCMIEAKEKGPDCFETMTLVTAINRTMVNFNHLEPR